MASGATKRILLPLGAAVVLLCAHPLLNTLFPRQSASISYVFFLGSTALALAACLWRAAHSPSGMRAKWILTSAGVLFWLAANLMEAVEQLLYHATTTTATIEDFFYFYYGIPLLIAIAMPEEGETIPLFLLLDVLQALAAGYLAYVALFASLPFTGMPEKPISVDRLVQIFDAENLILAVLATVRLIVGVRDATNRRFFQILTVFLWSYAICISIYNRLVGIYNLTGVLDVLSIVPFIVLALAVTMAAEPADTAAKTRLAPHFARMVDNARPVLVGLALLALSAIVARHHLNLALGFVFGAFVIYGVRSAVLQSRFQRTQIALEEARDRLEELALQDGLTGIANRRCFDQRLAFEWARAQRNRRPFALLLIDMDHFKQINDTWGHLAGDECLKFAATALRSALHRTGDLMARYGGEEFAVLLPETGAMGAREVAAHMQTVLAECAAGNPISAVCPMTVSIGVTAWEATGNATTVQLIETADKALYMAKQNGRDRIEFIELEPVSAW